MKMLRLYITSHLVGHKPKKSLKMLKGLVERRAGRPLFAGLSLYASDFTWTQLFDPMLIYRIIDCNCFKNVSELCRLHLHLVEILSHFNP